MLSQGDEKRLVGSMVSKKAPQPCGFFESRLPTVSSVTGLSVRITTVADCPCVATPSDSMSGFVSSRLNTATSLSFADMGQVTRNCVSPCSSTNPGTGHERVDWAKESDQTESEAWQKRSECVHEFGSKVGRWSFPRKFSPGWPDHCHTVSES
jgi:hypothetical protein